MYYSIVHSRHKHKLKDIVRLLYIILRINFKLYNHLEFY